MKSAPPARAFEPGAWSNAGMLLNFRTHSNIWAMACILLAGWGFLRSGNSAELQARTIDGQVIQGEYLGTEDNVVRIKTAYGTVTIPSKNIVTLLAVNSADKPEPVEKSGEAALAKNSDTPVLPAAALPPLKSTASITNPDGDAPAKIKTEGLVFREPKGLSLDSFLASRMPAIPEAVKQNRIELLRQVRNFAESNDNARAKVLRILQNYGLMAYPYIDGAYTSPQDLPEKVELLAAVALQHKPYSAGLFATTHRLAVSDMSRMVSAPPELPPQFISSRYPNPETARAQRLRIAARYIRQIEGYASIAAGPFNALFLLQTYKERYQGESDPLLKDIKIDSARLALTAADWKNSFSGWTPADRILFCEMAFPLYFSDNDDTRAFSREFLKKLLPEKHPKWDASQSDWVEWWTAQKETLRK